MELTKSILKEIANGKNAFEPKESSVQEVRDFQRVAKRLKSAHERKFIREAYFQISGERETHGLYITVLVSGGLTLEGDQYLAGTYDEFRKDKMTNQTINIHSANAVQIGDYNTQKITITIKSLVEAIESSNGSEVEKLEAKTLLQKFLAHSLVAAVVGATISLA